MYQLFHPTCKLLHQSQAFAEKDHGFHLEARCCKPGPMGHLDGRGTNNLGYWKCIWILLLPPFDIYQILACKESSFDITKIHVVFYYIWYCIIVTSFAPRSGDRDLFQMNWMFLPWIVIHSHNVILCHIMQLNAKDCTSWRVSSF